MIRRTARTPFMSGTSVHATACAFLAAAVFACAGDALVAAGGAGQDATSAAALYHGLQYRYIGPPGNRVEVVAGVAGDPSVIYAGAASGGVFKTTDAGLHWTPIFDGQDVASIGAISVAPSNPAVVWVGTGESFIRGAISVGNGVYKSVDGGTSWTRVGLENTGRISRILVDPANADIVYVASLGHGYGPQPERGVFRTVNGGRSWERVLFVDENTGAADMILDPSNPKTILAAMWQVAIHPWWTESGGPGSGIHVSRDGGTTWTRVSRGLPASPLGRIGLAAAASRPGRFYASIESNDPGTLWRSDDGGESWTMASRNPAVNRRARYFSRLAVLPDNPDELYFLTQQLGRTMDGGATVDVVPEVYPDQHDIWIDPKNPNRQIVANDRYVNISLNRGRTWFRAGLPNAQIYRVATDRQVPYNVFGARQDGPTFRGPSNSLLPSGLIPDESWEYAGYSESGYAIPDAADNEIVWVSDNRRIERFHTRIRSTHDATPWPLPTPGAGGVPGTGGERRFRLNWTAPMAMSPHDPHTMYAGSQVVHRTTDSGRTWSEISPDLTTNDKTKFGPSPGLGPDNQDVYCSLFAIAESPVVRGVIWAGSTDGLVHVTRDNGATWTNVTASLPNLRPDGTISSIEPSPHAGGTAYVSVDRHRANDSSAYIFKTTDFGKSWTQVAAGIPKSVFGYVRVVREDPKRAGLLYAGTENGVFVSPDDGRTWVALQNGLPHVPVSGMEVQRDFGDLVLSTFGRGFWILDDLSPLQQLTPAVLQAPHFLFEPRRIYLLRPGAPFIGSNLAIEFDVPASVGHNPPPGAPINYFLRAPAAGPVTLTIVGPDGTTVQTLDGPRAAGINRVWWDLLAERPRPSIPGLPFGPFNHPPAQVPPGAYTVRMSVDGKTYETTLTLKADPNAHWW